MISYARRAALIKRRKEEEEDITTFTRFGKIFHSFLLAFLATLDVQWWERKKGGGRGKGGKLCTEISERTSTRCKAQDAGGRTEKGERGRRGGGRRKSCASIVSS